MKDETLKAQGSPSWLMPPWFKKFYSNGDFSSGEGQPVVGKGRDAYIYCMQGKRKQLTHDYYYFKMRSEIITLWYGLGSSFLKLRNIPFTLVKVVSQLYLSWFRKTIKLEYTFTCVNTTLMHSCMTLNRICQVNQQQLLVVESKLLIKQQFPQTGKKYICIICSVKNSHHLYFGP